MLKIMYKCRGSVSVFLILVLLPMLTVASIFVDLSRVRMGKAMVVTAADLALNSALSQYDNMVKDIYGLFMTSQNIDEIYDKLEEYYKKAIMEQGVAADDASLYVQQIMSTFFKSADSGSDNLLGINTKEFDVSPVTNTTLVNPAVMKSQIVEFMKYRAPIEGGLSLLEGIKSFSNVQKQVKVVEEKTKYYEKKEALIDDLGNAWNQIREYQYRDIDKYPSESPIVNHGFPSEEFYVTEEINWLNSKKSDLESVYGSLLYYYKFGQALGSNLTGTKDGTSLGANLADLYKIYNNGKWHAVVQGSDSEVSTACGNVYVKGKDDVDYHLSSSGSGYDKEWTASSASDTKKVKYYVWNIDTLTYEPIDESSSIGITADSQSNAGELAAGLVQQYFDITGAIEASETYKLLNTWNQTDSYSYKLYVLYMLNKDVNNNGANSYPALMKSLTETLAKLNELWNYVSDTDNPGYNAYIKSMENYAYGDSNIKNYTESIKDKLTTDASGTYIYMYNSLIARISDDLNNYTRAQYNNKITGTYGVVETLRNTGNRIVEIDQMIDKKRGYLNSAKTYLTQAKTASTECDTARNSWSTSNEALGTDDPTGVSNKTEIQREKESVSTEMIDKMIARIDHALETLNALDSKLNEYKIANNYWSQLADSAGGNRVDINGLYSLLYNGIVSIGKLEEYNKPPKNENEYDEIKNALLSNDLYNVKVSTAYTISANEYALDLTKEQRSLFTWMYNNYKGRELPDIEGGSPVDEVKGKSEEAKNSDKNEINSAKENIANAKEQPVAKTEKDVSKFSASDADLPSNKVKELGELGPEQQKSLEEGSDESQMLSQVTGSGGGTGISGMFGEIINIVTGAASDLVDTLRDEIYISTYIMSNFTYSTYEAEQIDKYNKKNNASLEVKKMYSKSESDGNFTYTVEPGYDVITNDAKSLTNFPINPENNYMYGSEIEYMIYGDPTKDAFGTIYVIRFAFNTVYAFMDPQINSYTLSAATSLFGVPPLTPLIPLAKVAFTVAWALAESGVDIYLLKQGEAVPLMKTADTWVLLPGKIAKVIAGEVGEYVKGRVKDVIDAGITAGVAKLNEWTNMADEQLNELIQKYNDAANKKVTEIGQYITSLEKSYTSQINSYAHQAINEYVSVCNSVRQRVNAIPSTIYTDEELQSIKDEDLFFYDRIVDGDASPLDIAEIIEHEMNVWLNNQASGGIDNAIYEAQMIAVKELTESTDKIFADYTDLTSSMLADGADEMKSKIDTVINNHVNAISDKVKYAIDYGTGYIKKGKDNVKKKIDDAVSGGADKLREYASKGVDSMFDGISNLFSDSASVASSDKSKNIGQSMVANLLSWRYSDYLRAFLLVNLFANDAKVLTRMADVMQTNIRNMPDGNKDFLFSKAYTYMSLTTEAEVKPLLSVGFLSYLGVENSTSDWYKIEYTNILGY